MRFKDSKIRKYKKISKHESLRDFSLVDSKNWKSGNLSYESLRKLGIEKYRDLKLQTC